jgi:hypothetical protein
VTLRWLPSVACVSLVIAACGSGSSDQPTGETAAVRWLAAKPLHGGRTVRIVYGESSGKPPVEVLVRSTDAEVGLTVQIRNPKNYVMDLRLWCLETTLAQPLGSRRLVDDAPGKFNPYGGLAAARQALDDDQLPCHRIPAKAVE